MISLTARRTALLASLVLVVAVLPVANALAAPAPAPVAAGRYLLQLDAGAPGGHTAAERSARQHRIDDVRARVLQRIDAEGATTLRTYAGLPYVAVEGSGPALGRLRAASEVTALLPDRVFHPTLSTSSVVVGATTAAAAGFDGTGQTVAVLDSGVQASHPFFGGRVVDEACYSRSGSCPNARTTQLGTGAAAPCTYDAAACVHGTHVAGIAAGSKSTYSGIARAASIAAVQIFSRVDSTTDCGPTQTTCAVSWTSDLLAGLDHVAQLAKTRSIASVNLSVGGGSYPGTCDADEPALTTAINALRDLGIATVVASGNEGTTSAMASPACISTAVAVGATLSTITSDAVTSFSNSSPELDLLAPGSGIRSSIPTSVYGLMSGTSMATPHVAGAMAVLKQKLPGASVADMVLALKTTGTPVLDTREGRTTPRIRVDLALAALTVAPIVTVVPPTASPTASIAPSPSAAPPAPAIVPTTPVSPSPTASPLPVLPVLPVLEPTSVRLSGADRYDTAATIFSRAFGCPAGGVGSVVLARGDAFADALAGSYLAGAKASGVLLTAPTSLPVTTLAALRGSGARTVYLLGGSSAISEAVAGQLARTPSVDCSGTPGPALQVVRIAGANRFDTARLTAAQPGTAAVGTAELGGGALRTAVVASGLGFADALAAGPLSYSGAATSAFGSGGGFPTLLTTASSLAPEAEAALTALRVQQVVIPGGTAVVGPAVEARLRALGLRVVRLAGSNRTETAALVARFAVDSLGFGRSGVTLARGDAFADALAGAAYAGHGSQPLLLTASPSELSDATRAALVASSARTVTAFGGLGAVSGSALDDALRSLAL